MDLPAHLSSLIEQAKTAKEDKVSAVRALTLMDLTSLNDNDTPDVISALCSKASCAHGHVAAVCVYAPFVAQAKKELAQTDVKVATVVSFPGGDASIEKLRAETRAAVAAGADEIDVVFPYKAFIADPKGSAAQCRAFLDACREETGAGRKMKVIFETGAFNDAALLSKACHIAIEAGADMLKTSTGKAHGGATLEAAAVLMDACKTTQGRVGFKASGGVRTAQEAAQYLMLADALMGSQWASRETFRFGASSLLGSLLTTIDPNTAPKAKPASGPAPTY